MTITALQVNALIARLRAPLVPHDRPSSIDQLTEDAADALANLLKQIEALKPDADRWRKFEGDCGDEHGEIIDHQRRRRAHPPRLTPWTPIDMATVQIVDDIVPVRQIRFRWLDIDGKRRTVREMIDGQLKELNEAKSS
jgi:hypothetical protein